MTTSFSRTYIDGTLGADWPYGWDRHLIVVEGVLAEDIREKLSAPGALVEIVEKRSDGGYSEYTRDDDYEFRLIVNGTEVLRETRGICSVMPGFRDEDVFDGTDPHWWNLRWLLDWLERN